MSLITVDGNLYSFTIDYAAQPSQLNILIENKNQQSANFVKDQAIKLSSGNNQALYKAIAQKIEASKVMHVGRTSLDQIQLRVSGIYVNTDVIYFRLQLKNKSNISYDIDNIRFSIKDTQKSIRTATQEIELKPVYIHHKFNKVQAESSTSCIIALPKFTLPHSKYLSIQTFEKNGSRNLTLALTNKHIMKAVAISE